MVAPCRRRSCRIRNLTGNLYLGGRRKDTRLIVIAVPVLTTSMQAAPLKTDCSSVCYQNQVCFVPDCITGILTQLLMQQGTKVPKIRCVSEQHGHREEVFWEEELRDWVHVCHLKLEGICQKWTLISTTDSTVTADDWLMKFTATKHDYLPLSSSFTSSVTDALWIKFNSILAQICSVFLLLPC